MSFNNFHNDWSGPSDSSKYTAIVSTSNFPLTYVTSGTAPISSNQVQNYDLPNYLALGKLTSNNTNLWAVRGGFSNVTPTQQLAFNKVLQEYSTKSDNGKVLEYGNW